MNDVRLSSPPPAIVGFDPTGQTQMSPSQQPVQQQGMATRAFADEPNPQGAGQATNKQVPVAKKQATDTIAAKAGAMVNEIDFPGFVAQLVNGTFDAIVDASIRQMESYSDLVASVSKSVDQFTGENVTDNQARDWLAQKHAGDVVVVLPGDQQQSYQQQSGPQQPHLAPRADGLSPDWLAEFDMAGEELTTETLEERLLPQVRNRVGAERQQLLATMVMLGINRVAVRDGSITAKVMFRANAQDVAKVGYATGSDPQQQLTQNWGQRGSRTYQTGNTMVSTLAVNAQNESSVRADLFGEVKLNFASETLPLEQLTDAASVALVQRHTPALSQQQLQARNSTPITPPQPGANQGGQQ